MPLLNTPLQDVSLPADATDTITSLRWSPVSDHLAAASWDGKVRIYDVANDGRAQSVASIAADGPVFSCDWNKVSPFSPSNPMQLLMAIRRSRGGFRVSKMKTKGGNRLMGGKK